MKHKPCKNKSPCVFGFNKKLSLDFPHLLKTGNTTEFSPLSGSEPKYEPKKWNLKKV